jgi:hypothetical protein
VYEFILLERTEVLLIDVLNISFTDTTCFPNLILFVWKGTRGRVVIEALYYITEGRRFQTQ